jgi:CheY-like chemotaxis protein
MPASSLKVLVVDASVVARLVAARALGPDVEVIQAANGQDALRLLTSDVNMVVMALRLPRMDGQALARMIRAIPAHMRTPILVVSGDTREALVGQSMGHDVTDYFDKSEGMEALQMFFQCYLYPDAPMTGRVLHVEDSRSIAAITARMLTRRGLVMTLATSAEDAIAVVQAQMVQSDVPKMEMILCDHYLIGEKTGLDVVQEIRVMPHAVAHLPILITTGEEKPELQRALLSAGADDLLEKPVREVQLVAKIRYHLWRSSQAMQAPKPVALAVEN